MSAEPSAKGRETISTAWVCQTPWAPAPGNPSASKNICKTKRDGHFASGVFAEVARALLPELLAARELLQDNSVRLSTWFDSKVARPSRHLLVTTCVA